MLGIYVLAFTHYIKKKISLGKSLMTEHETGGSILAYILWWSQNISRGVKLNL